MHRERAGRVAAMRPVTPPGWRRGGFTLIEVMIVVVIFAIMASMATLALSSAAGRETDAEARRFVEIAELLRDEALLLGQPRAIGIASDGYAALALQPIGDGEQSWQPRASGVLIPHDLARRDARLRLRLDGRRAALQASADGAPDQVRIDVSPTGEFAPFELWIGSRDESRIWRIRPLEDAPDRLEVEVVERFG